MTTKEHSDKAGEMNFELSFRRLEEILDRMNSGHITLDESLKLYEEADQLILSCAKSLNSAEMRIEALIKNRNQQLLLDPEEKPLVQEFQPQE
jgi:exodeoxyribonuclease VII small subunit